MTSGSCFLHADAATFRWLAGEDRVRRFESSPGNFRAFCTVCGSNMPVLESNDTHVIIPAGTLDGDPGVRPIVHIHTAAMDEWHEITDDLPRYAGFPPREFWAPYE